MVQSAKLFVYGTLRKNERYHHLMNDCTLIAEQAWVHGQLFDSGQGYPSLLTSENNREKAFGELYEVTFAQLELIDKLEDYVPGRKNNLYERISLTIYTDKGKETAYVYVANEAGGKLHPIKYGDWKLDHLMKNRPEKTHYFAYGSCMDTERFLNANVGHFFKKVIGVAVLEKYSMKYTFSTSDGGRADLIEDGGRTEGILYEVPYEGVEYLFKREGFYNNYYRPTFVDIVANDTVIKSALTFHVYEKLEEAAPPIHYATEILRGSKGRVSEEYYRHLIHSLKKLNVKIENINV